VGLQPHEKPPPQSHLPCCRRPSRSSQSAANPDAPRRTRPASGLNDHLVEQNRSGAYTQIVYAPSGGKLALMNGSTLQKGFVPLPGGATAVYNSTGLAYYRHADWLGTSRFASTPSRTMYSDTAYGPFGEPYAQAGTADPSFTGQNQDTVSNLNDFPAREYGTQGRWPSPDPAGIASADPTDPQSWNRYAYVRNSPLLMVDPSGLDGLDYDDLLQDGFDWEGDFGWGTSYTMDGAPAARAVAQGAVGNADAAIQCVICQTPGRGWDSTGVFAQVDYVALLCIGPSLSSFGCKLGPKGREYLDVINPDDIYFPSESARIDYTLGLSGTLAKGYLISSVLNMALGDVGGVVGALPTMNVAVGAGQPFHVAFGVGDTWLNAVGPSLGNMVVSRYLAVETAETSWFMVSIPIWNESGVLMSEGCSAFSCVTAASSALGKGWLP